MMSENMSTSKKTKSIRKWGGGFVWLVIAGIVLIHLAFFVRYDVSIRQILLWGYYLLDWHHWPVWYAINFWIVATGVLTAFLLRHKTRQQNIRILLTSPKWQGFQRYFTQSAFHQLLIRKMLHGKITKRLLRRWVNLGKFLSIEYVPILVECVTVLLVLFVLFNNATLVAPARHAMFSSIYYFPYRGIYQPFFYDPVMNYLNNGAISWRLFVVPIVTFLIAFGLLRLNGELKKWRKSHGQ